MSGKGTAWRARGLVQRAVKNGSLSKPKACQECGRKTQLQAHHHRGYSDRNALNVLWLCRACHGWQDREKLGPRGKGVLYLRISDELGNALKAQAKKNKRSLNKEIEAILLRYRQAVEPNPLLVEHLRLLEDLRNLLEESRLTEAELSAR